MSGTVLLAAGAGALGLAIAMVVMAVLPAHRGVAGALAAIDRAYGQAGPRPERVFDPLAALPGWLRWLAARLSPGALTASLQRRLDLAGNPARWTPDRILAVKGLGLLAGGVFGALYGLGTPALALLGAAVGGCAGFYLPDLLLYNSGQKRQAEIQKALPDALDMLTVCVEAGLGFDAAIAQVARNAEGPLAAEFTRALQEMQIGKTRTEALRSMVTRTTVADLRAFVSAVVQAGELGIAVAQVLREQSREMRVRRRQRAEERAQKIPVKIMFPLIFCMLPSLFVAIIGAGVIEIMHTLFGAHGLFVAG